MRDNRARHFFVVLGVALLCSAAAAPPQQQTLNLDPAHTEVHYTVDSTFHTVHGTFRLKSGSIQFDPAGGMASGQIVVDASSGDSGTKSRDHKMTKEILEADKYSEIVFTPQQMKGTLAPSGQSQIQLDGTITLHGQQHPLTLNVQANVQGNALSADTSFVIPYIQWGLKNPSAFLLRVSDKVDIHIHAVGQIQTAGAAKQPSR
jgi:polyisoprenoid-binding protein YceI